MRSEHHSLRTIVAITLPIALCLSSVAAAAADIPPLPAPAKPMKPAKQTKPTEAIKETKESFRGIGDLPGGDFYSEVSGISADGGTVVGWSSSAAASPGSNQAFAWSATTGIVGLPDLEGGPFRANAGAATKDGRVIVGDSAVSEGSAAVRWNAKREAIALGDLEDSAHPSPAGGRFSTARGISPDGRFIVGCSTSPRGLEAFLWEDGKGMLALGDAEGGRFNSAAQTVDPTGSIIFGSASVASGVNVFRWTRESGMRVLGDLPGGGEFSEPYAATADGRVAIGRAQSAASGGERFEAFRWSADREERGDSGLEALGDLEGGEFESWALGLSADGRVVVGFGTTDRGQEAMIWTAEAGMARLADRIAKDPNADLKGWTLTWATAVSGDGRTITGHGRNPRGDTEGWVWRAPVVAAK